MLKLVVMIKNIFEGLFTVFKHLFRKPVTVEYPEKGRILPDRFRGKFNLENCIGCGVCKRVCPSGAISIQKDEEGKIDYKFDLKKCIFCGNCMYYCPKKAITMTNEFRLATTEKSDLILGFRGGKSAE